MAKPKRISERVIGCAMTVSNTLGSGFFESVYEKALMVELSLQGIKYQNQRAYDVLYRNKQVGSYIADVVIENQILLELKAVSALRGEHEAQVMNYLKASGLSVGLLINFGSPKLQFK